MSFHPKGVINTLARHATQVLALDEHGSRRHGATRWISRSSPWASADPDFCVFLCRSPPSRNPCEMRSPALLGLGRKSFPPALVFFSSRRKLHESMCVNEMDTTCRDNATRAGMARRGGPGYATLGPPRPRKFESLMLFGENGLEASANQKSPLHIPTQEQACRSAMRQQVLGLAPRCGGADYSPHCAETH